jgi:hypothetical protein
VTALSLTACVLLVALWVWSYEVNYVFEVHRNDGRVHGFEMMLGQMTLYTYSSFGEYYYQYDYGPQSIENAIANGDASNLIRWQKELGTVLGFRIDVFQSDLIVIAPMWFLAMLPLAVTVLPWIKFSLRTVLIAMTLVAVALAVIVYAAR